MIENRDGWSASIKANAELPPNLPEIEDKIYRLDKLEPDLVSSHLSSVTFSRFVLILVSVCFSLKQ